MAQPKLTAADHGKRLARGPITIGALTERVAKPALGKRGFAGGEILFGYQAIDKVQAAQGPLPRAKKPPMPLKPAAPSPSTVAEALERLGEAVQQRSAAGVNVTYRFR